LQAKKVGDDVLGDDPTIIELETYCCDLFGMEASFILSFWQQLTNPKIAIKVHYQSMEKLILQATIAHHLYRYEGGGTDLIRIIPLAYWMVENRGKNYSRRYCSKYKPG